MRQRPLYVYYITTPGNVKSLDWQSRGFLVKKRKEGKDGYYL